jgi:cytochrome c
MRRRAAATALGTAVALLVSAAAALEPDEERGLVLAWENCARCHAIGEDDVSRLPAAPPFRELHERYPVEHLAEAFVEGIVTGHRGMPEFRFEPEEAEDLIAYLRTLE